LPIDYQLIGLSADQNAGVGGDGIEAKRRSGTGLAGVAAEVG
jgi:hypothetical protein